LEDGGVIFFIVVRPSRLHFFFVVQPSGCNRRRDARNHNIIAAHHPS
jgi:hypothetical protein